jgi:carbonic anhydrase
MFKRATLRADLVAGASVASVAVPLALAIAVVSGAPPVAGLITAVLAGLIGALFGGTPLAVSGPGAAMAVLVADVFARHGMGGVLVVGVACGTLQLVTGVLGLGRLVRLVPLPVVQAFSAAIGVLLIVMQLPQLLGLTLPHEANVLAVLDRVGGYLPQAKPFAVGAAVISLALVVGLPRLSKRIPAPLVAVAVPALIVGLARLDVPTIDAIPWRLPMPSVPALPSTGIAGLVGDALTLFALASLETLLSSSAIDDLARGGKRHDPDQELIGQGLGNVAVAFFGGIPATPFVARSALNVDAGGRTRLAAIVQSLIVLGAAFVIAPLARFVPVAALAAVILPIAARMVRPSVLRELYRISRAEAVIYVVTVAAIVLLGLVQGVQTGLVLALVVACVRLARTRATVHPGSDGAAHQLGFSGALTFLASPELERVRDVLAGIDPKQGVAIDLRNVLAIDATGCEGLVAIVDDLDARGGKIALLGASSQVRERLIAADRRGTIGARLVVTEKELDTLLGQEKSFAARAHLLAGIQRFRSEVREHYEPLFDQLDDGQTPHSMLITCVDSRISPAMLMGAHPGELFILRCLGALVPPAGTDSLPGEGAAIEYGVGVLGVRNIIVCAHSRCGALSALRQGQVPPQFSTLQAWLAASTLGAGPLGHFADGDQATRGALVRQLDNLRTYPLIREGEANGELTLLAWYYDVGAAELYEWEPEKRRFVVLGDASQKALPGPVDAPPAAAAEAGASARAEEPGPRS